MDSQYFCVGHESFVLSPRENWYATMLGQPAVKISPVKSFEPPLLKDFAPPKWNTDISLRILQSRSGDIDGLAENIGTHGWADGIRRDQVHTTVGQFL